MTIAAQLELAALDARDIDALASFYTQLTGWQTARSEPDWITLRTQDGQEIAFQEAPDHLPPRWPGQQRPQQFHLDLLVDGHEQAASRAVELGATRIGDGATWITLADPAGHPFDLCQRDGVGTGLTLFAVTIDAPDASTLARFYAELLGMDLSYEGAEGALISGAGKSLMFQQVNDYNPPEWRNPARPQQGHLDILVDDLDQNEARALELGALRLARGGSVEGDTDGEQFRVFSDPAGHPFCLTC